MIFHETRHKTITMVIPNSDVNLRINIRSFTSTFQPFIQNIALQILVIAAYINQQKLLIFTTKLFNQLTRVVLQPFRLRIIEILRKRFFTKRTPRSRNDRRETGTTRENIVSFRKSDQG